MSISKAPVWLGKTALVFLALTAASMAGGMIFYAGYQPPEGAPETDPEAMMKAGLIVQAGNAILLAVLASWSRVSRLWTAVFLFALLFFVQTVLSLMEMAFFNEFFGMPLDDAPRNLAMAGLTALVGSGVAALLFAGKAASLDAFEQRPRASIAWRFALAVALYPAAYWVAGIIFVVLSESALDFYGDDVTSRVEAGPLLALQIVRGAIWAGLAFAAVHALRGSRAARGAIVGVAFAVFMILPLLYPNAYMPETVRMIHAVEIAISNFIYGFVAAFVLAPRHSGAERYPAGAAA